MLWVKIRLVEKLQNNTDNYSQWQIDRQKYWDNINTHNASFLAVLTGNQIRTESYKSADSYYNELGAQIQARQQAQQPIAGEGLMEFLPYFGGAMRLGSYFFPPLRFVAYGSDAILLHLEETSQG